MVSDVRFPNEAKWIHEKWNGWFIHVKKYKTLTAKEVPYSKHMSYGTVVEECEPYRVYDAAPNEEEAKQDPLIQELADDRVELENVIEREARKGNKITVADLPDNMYPQEEIRLCLAKIPFLKIS